ncbi:MAG: hypothetical protein A2Y67_03810 [Candidatus Buchananbacteria bacterium RBG_13_39_9]|uniref:Uncharacterized protein n=1 Tax=Candidatus Buchananbacteria bacterium RBG_13_39_9 TaxID=1797531 RepID=A0A1G1XS64_9BACT|nr:MAG: hypothetical protein A2Y67_03810 [Candidatus Buchananbacteria bacterium RBG_13_39_9]
MVQFGYAHCKLLLPAPSLAEGLTMTQERAFSPAPTLFNLTLFYGIIFIDKTPDQGLAARYFK